mgnify:CR=1 FL=1
MDSPITAVESESLEQLAQAIDTKLETLTPAQVRFCIAIAAGEEKAKAYQMAGYKNRNPRVSAWRLWGKPHIKEAVALLRRRYAMENGIGLAWKRQRVIDAINLAESEGQPSPMISGVRLLAELDGDIGNVTTAAGIEITIVTGVDRGEPKGIDQGVMIENQ